MSERSTSDRINARLSGALSEFVSRMVGETGLYETPSEYVRDLIRRDMERREGQLAQESILTGYRDSEYVRDLIRRDMERREGQLAQESILTGYRDMATGRTFVSSGDFKDDMKTLAKKEEKDWQ